MKVFILLNIVLFTSICFAELPVYENHLYPFTTDGCSKAPDFNFSECCKVHDYYYWKGGSSKEKKKADQLLGQCIKNATYDIIGTAYEKTVRVFGLPFWRTSYRWGYGWKYYRPMEKLTASEQTQVEDYNYTLGEVLSTRITPAQNRLEDYPSETGDYCLDEVNEYLKKNSEKLNIANPSTYTYKIIPGLRIKGRVRSDRIYKVYFDSRKKPIRFYFGKISAGKCKDMRKISKNKKFLKKVKLN